MRVTFTPQRKCGFSNVLIPKNIEVIFLDMLREAHCPIQNAPFVDSHYVVLFEELQINQNIARQR